MTQNNRAKREKPSETQALLQILALEGAGAGITATALCPGYVRTPLVEAQIFAQAASHGLPVRQTP